MALGLVGKAAMLISQSLHGKPNKREKFTVALYICLNISALTRFFGLMYQVSRGGSKVNAGCIGFASTWISVRNYCF